MSEEPTIIGELSAHALARDFAAVVRRVHHRYATEVVGAFTLCPFMKDPQTAFGKFVVVLSRELDVDLAATLLTKEEIQVAHVIYPMTTASPADFERFGNALHDAVTSRTTEGPVHASFHPQMAGSTESAAKLVGFVRRAPDPFVQFIPEGLHQGGSQFIDPEDIDLATLLAKAAEQGTVSNSKSIFSRLTPQQLRRIQYIIEDIQQDRADSYATFLSKLAGD